MKKQSLTAIGKKNNETKTISKAEPNIKHLWLD
jgi:hypothetical protein